VKEITVILFTHYMPQLVEILRKHKIGGMSWHEVWARGPTRRSEIPDAVRAYSYGKKVTAETEKRTKVQTLIPDSVVDTVVQELVTSLGSESDPAGIVYVNDVPNAYLLGTNRSGEDLLIKD
jgi:nitrogen regulatory protein P-II 1